MKKILLVNPGHDNEHEKYKHKSHRIIHRDPAPLGALYVGTYLSDKGYDVEIFDTHIEEDYSRKLISMIQSNDYLYIGITVIIGKFLRNAKELTEIIRLEAPEIPVVWGGIMASISPELILRKYLPDYIIRYEGEKISYNLALALEGKKDISEVDGLSYIKNNRIIHNKAQQPELNLDEYPIPKWKLLQNAFNKEQRPYYYSIMSSRGCVYNCSFCYKHSIDDDVRKKVPPWRGRSAEHIIEEVEYINKNTETRVFTFGDDNFFVNKKRVLKILKYFKKNNFYIEECIGHINGIDDEIINAMAGVVQTFIFSIESASPRLQKYINKSLTLEDVPYKVEQMYKKGIVASTSFIIGLPTEEKADLRKNIDLMMNLKKINPFIRGNIYLYFPLPKTKLFNTVEEECSLTLVQDIEEYENANFWVKGIDDPIGKIFRPWMSEELFNFLVLYGIVFNDVFSVCNIEFKENTKKILSEDAEIREMFQGIENVNHPSVIYRPYILDRVLGNEKIDLINDLKDK